MDSGPIIDVDIHHTWASDAVVTEYLPAEWKSYFGTGTSRAESGRYGRFQPPALRYPLVTGSSMRPEFMPPGGGLAGSSYEMLRDQHLDPHGITRAILTWGAGMHAGLIHAAASAAVCRAANDYMLDHWLGRGDDRLYGTLCVPVAVADEAIKEIRRLGRHPRIAAVLMVANPLGKPLGHPVYRPILRAAAEHGLIVITHVGSDLICKGWSTAGGLPTTRIDNYTLLEHPGMHHLTSVLAEGVFDDIPDLRVLLNEYGFLWMPWVLWGLDARYGVLKKENPRLNRLPSEYFREHVWTSTQPFVAEADPGRITALVRTFGGLEDQMCYSSDYPHWDTEWPDQVAPRLPKAWRAQVLAGNAARLFRWAMDDLNAAARRHARRAAAGGARS